MTATTTFSANQKTKAMLTEKEMTELERKFAQINQDEEEFEPTSWIVTASEVDDPVYDVSLHVLAGSFEEALELAHQLLPKTAIIDGIVQQ